MAEFRFRTVLPLRHTDSFGGTPFVHGGVLLALTEIALATYDEVVGIPKHREVLRFQSHTEVRYLAPLRWTDAASSHCAARRCARADSPSSAKCSPTATARPSRA